MLEGYRPGITSAAFETPQYSSYSEKARQLLRVEAHHNLAVNQRDGRGHIAKPLKLLERRFILADVAFFVGNAFLRKKLFRPIAEHSVRLAEYRNLVRHGSFPPVVLFDLSTTARALDIRRSASIPEGGQRDGRRCGICLSIRTVHGVPSSCCRVPSNDSRWKLQSVFSLRCPAGRLQSEQQFSPTT